MAKSMAGRKVRMFRCQIPPQLTQRVQQAHIPQSMGMEAEVDQDVMGVWVKTKEGNEHFIPFTNIQSMELYPEEQVLAFDPAFDPSKKLGRQSKSEAV